MLVTWFREGYVSQIIQKFVKFGTPDLPSLRVAFPEDACALLMDAYLSERKDGKGEIYNLKGFMRWPWVLIDVDGGCLCPKANSTYFHISTT